MEKTLQGLDVAIQKVELSKVPERDTPRIALSVPA